MSEKYRIQSVIVSPSGWLFEATHAKFLSKTLDFSSSKKHGDTRHIVTYACTATSLDEAWRLFYKEVEEFVEAAAFQTSSYLSFHDWNHLIVNETRSHALIVIFPRKYGTSLTLHNQERVNDVHTIMARAKADKRLKKFLHCYRMAILVDAPETHDAYEKYLLLACEALAGEVIVKENRFLELLRYLGIRKRPSYTKHDRARLIQIIGKELHKYFFSSINPKVKKTIRNANMHEGKSPNEKPAQTIKLVNKLREFVAKEYGLTALPIVKEQHSPTRGLYRDDGQRLFVGGKGVKELDLRTIKDLSLFLKSMPANLRVLTNEEAKTMFSKEEDSST